VDFIEWNIVVWVVCGGRCATSAVLSPGVEKKKRERERERERDEEEEEEARKKKKFSGSLFFFFFFFNKLENFIYKRKMLLSTPKVYK
jgi:hypothetical protein